MTASPARATVLVALGGLALTIGIVLSFVEVRSTRDVMRLLGALRESRTWMPVGLLSLTFVVGAALIHRGWLGRRNALDALYGVWTHLGAAAATLTIFAMSLHFAWDGPRFGYWSSSGWRVSPYNTW